MSLSSSSEGDASRGKGKAALGDQYLATERRGDSRGELDPLTRLEPNAQGEGRPGPRVKARTRRGRLESIGVVGTEVGEVLLNRGLVRRLAHVLNVVVTGERLGGSGE